MCSYGRFRLVNSYPPFTVVQTADSDKEVEVHILSRDSVTPIDTEHGEVIYELIGRTIGEEPTQRHSVAYVVIPPGKSSLLHRHPAAEESYYILRGQARVLLGNEEASVAPGAAILIPSRTAHQIINVGNEDLEFIAFCVPAWELNNSDFLEDTAHEESSNPSDVLSAGGVYEQARSSTGE
jgi:mannose-6-phosphate isomerase-like protein (cupin superfamily)